MNDKRVGIKELSLIELNKRGINIPEYFIPKELLEFIEYMESNRRMTVMFDSEYDTRSLPFYVFEDVEYDRCIDIWEEATRRKCNIILSGIHSNEDSLMFNSVVNIRSDGRFYANVGFRKETLREMLNRSSIPIVGCVNEIEQITEYASKYDVVTHGVVLKSIQKLFSLGVRDKTIEYSMYENRIGRLMKNIVCWRLR